MCLSNPVVATAACSSMQNIEWSSLGPEPRDTAQQSPSGVLRDFPLPYAICVVDPRPGLCTVLKACEVTLYRSVYTRSKQSNFAESQASVVLLSLEGLDHYGRKAYQMSRCQV